MAVYTVHEPPVSRSDARRGPERFVFVRDGFHWWAFVLTPLWLLYRRLWLAFVIYAAVALAIGFALKLIGVPNGAMWLAQVFLSAIVGLEAATLIRRKLAWWGWHEAGYATGRGIEDAERRFFDGWTGAEPRLVSAPAPAFAAGPAAQRARNADIVGLFPEPGASR